MNVHVFPTPDETARAVALRVADVVRSKPDAVLGLPAGRTPISTYRELQELHARGELDFAHVRTFNLDEFVGEIGRAHV